MNSSNKINDTTGTAPKGLLPEGSRRFLIALVVCVVTMTMFAMGKNVPSDLMTVLGMVVGFYFGSRSK